MDTDQPKYDIEVCSDCHQLEEKGICFRCNIDGMEIHPSVGDICSSCKKEGWNCYYDYYTGKIHCYKR